MGFKRTLALGTALLVNMTLATAADTTEVIKLDKALCVVCHGIGGRSTSPLFPRIAGQNAAYLEEELKEFKTHYRGDKDAQDYMWGWAGLLSEDEIKLLAAYYEKQTPAPGIPADPALSAKGEAIFKKGIESQGVPACMACHGENGEGNGKAVPPVPRLAGQNPSYLVKQLKVYQGDKRPAGLAMHVVVQTLTEEEMNQVAAYLQSK